MSIASPKWYELTAPLQEVPWPQLSVPQGQCSKKGLFPDLEDAPQ
jgi:hypothetical protein